MENKLGSVLSGLGHDPSATAGVSDAVTGDTSVLLTSGRIISRPAAHHNVRRFVIGFISLFACVSGIWSAGRAGISHLLSAQALEDRRPALVNEAVRLSPSDPQA